MRNKLLLFRPLRFGGLFIKAISVTFTNAEVLVTTKLHYTNQSFSSAVHNKEVSFKRKWSLV